MCCKIYDFMFKLQVMAWTGGKLSTNFLTDLSRETSHDFLFSCTFQHKLCISGMILLLISICYHYKMYTRRHWFLLCAHLHWGNSSIVQLQIWNLKWPEGVHGTGMSHPLNFQNITLIQQKSCFFSGSVISVLCTIDCKYMYSEILVFSNLFCSIVVCHMH